MMSELVRSSIPFVHRLHAIPLTYFFFFLRYKLFTGTVFWQAEGKDGILLMSAYCINTVASPLFLSAILIAHLNKALNVSSCRSLKS